MSKLTDGRLCVNCRSTIPSQTKGRSRKYCSKQCHTDFNNKRLLQNNITNTAATISCVCKECSKEFLVYKSQLKYKTKNFCSSTCTKAFALKKNTHTCKQCNKVFLSNRNNVQFCSRSCCDTNQLTTQRPPSVCTACGVTFYKKLATMRKGGIYCSAACSRGHKSIKVKKSCLNCNTVFMTYPSQNRDTCSNKCRNAYNSIITSQRWSSMTPEERAEALSKISNTKTINKLESKVLTMCPPNVEFTGDRKFWIPLFTSNYKSKNPDFVVRPFHNTKSVIEVFGDYWHEKSEAQDLIDAYKSRGIKCLLLWENDIHKNPEDTKLKIQEFVTRTQS